MGLILSIITWATVVLVKYELVPETAVHFHKTRLIKVHAIYLCGMNNIEFHSIAIRNIQWQQAEIQISYGKWILL